MEVHGPAWPDTKQLSELRLRDLLELREPANELTIGQSGEVQFRFSLPMPALSQIELTITARKLKAENE